MRLVYHYTNHISAGLVDTIDDYPHLSLWSAFLSGQRIEAICGRVRRNKIPALPEENLSRKFCGSMEARKFYASMEAQVGAEAVGDCSFSYDPFGWTDCFHESQGCGVQKIQTEVLRRVRAIESERRAARTKPVLGAEARIYHKIRRPHTPKKFGKRMICLATSIESRVAFVGFFKALSAHARDIIARLRLGEKVRPPPSYFGPSGYLVASIPRLFVPLPLG